MKRLAIGIDIGGTNTKLGLVTGDGQLYSFRSFKTNKNSLELYYKELCEHIKGLLEYKKQDQVLKDVPMAGIGIGAPNANFNTGCIESAVNLAWGRTPIAEMLEKSFGMPASLDNDANTAAVGEWLFGVAKGVRDFVLVTLGTGVGSGVFAEGRIIRSQNGKAGEGGHVVVEKNGRPCGCGGFGHLECYASSRGVELTAKEIFKRDLTTYELAELIGQNDPRALQVLDTTSDWIGLGLSTICAVLNPSLIVLGGGVSLLSPDFAQKTQEALDRYAFKAIAGEAKVLITSTCQNTGSVLGAGALILSPTHA